MKSQDAYKLVFCNYPDIVNVEQMCEMLGGISQKTAYRLFEERDNQKFCCRTALPHTQNLYF